MRRICRTKGMTPGTIAKVIHAIFARLITTIAVLGGVYFFTHYFLFRV